MLQFLSDIDSLIAGATLACGTGTCAVVVAAVLEGHSERVGFITCYHRNKLHDIPLLVHQPFKCKQKCMVDLPGGPLEIDWKEEDNHVYMTGPAEVSFHGSVCL